MISNRFYERIDKIDDINILSELVCKEYKIGNLIDTLVLEFGYEDFNAIITTDTGKYFMKVFKNSRTDKDVEDCIGRTWQAYQNGVKVPQIYLNSENKIVTIFTHLNSRFRVTLMQYINGKNFFELKRKPNDSELEQIVSIASSLSKIDYKPNFLYDTWAITSFCGEYEKKKKYLSSEYYNLVNPIYEKFKKFDYDKLPKSFVHGDMMSTNLLIDDKGEIWLIDFSVSNYMARINELIVICDDIALIVNNKEESERRIKNIFNQWCNEVKATDFEKESFQILYDVANAINVLITQYEIKELKNDSEETIMHLEAGLFGLSLFK